jgi:predicted FMN-binding regulatory protein PaiB
MYVPEQFKVLNEGEIQAFMFKLGQNRRLEDRAGTIKGLEREKSADGLALAAFMRSRVGS